MANLYKYRVWCNTEGKYVETWEENPPTHCPNNVDHTINTNKTAVVMKKEKLAPTDQSGKERIHQSSRKIGLMTIWTGEGDDTSDMRKIGGGQPCEVNHVIGDPMDEVIYIDFNIASNETWLHEGYLSWKGCDFDKVSFEIVPRVTNIQAGTNTNYNLYGGYLIVPAAGDGTIDLVDDMHNPNNGLIMIPDTDIGGAPQAFWDADYNPTTRLYENITPVPTGEGRYNMFSTEITFARFINRFPLLKDGFIALSSSDTDQMGQGMRVKMMAHTNSGVDHDWGVAFLICMHRTESVGI